MTAIEVKADDETPELGGKAVDPMVEAILAAQSAEADAVSGATITSKAIMSAVKDCIRQANGEEAAANSYTPGTYTATTKGMKGEVTVEVTFDETSIKSVEVKEQAETFGVGYGLPSAPVETIPGKIVETQSLGVDLVTGATVTSNAIVNAVADTVEQAGGDADVLKAVQVPSENKDEVLEADVVVVGAGVAGLSAAITAAEAGANVVVLEKQGIPGGSTTLSGGKLLAAGTSYQEAQGYTGDTPDALFDYLKYVGTIGGEGMIDDAKLHEFTDNALEDIHWLEDMGVNIINVEPIHSSITPWRVMNTLGGGGQTDGHGGQILVPMFHRFMETPAEIHYNVTVNEVLMKDGRAAGVKGVRPDGTTVIVNADSVVIATGGYAQNREMMAHLGVENYVTGIPKGNVGDGVKMATAVGADYYEAPGAQAVYVSFTCGVGINEESGMIVSDAGERVVDEFSYQSHVASALIRKGAQKAWYIASANEPYPTVQYGMTLDTTLKAETPEELAELMGVPADTFVKQFNDYNEMCAKGKDTQFNKPAEYMIPLEGTLYAIEMNPSFTVTFGGLVTDLDSQVLDTEGNVIPGLYAAGEVALTGLFGDEYPSCGLAIGAGLRYGRIAGENAAK